MGTPFCNISPTYTTQNNHVEDIKIVFFKNLFWEFLWPGTAGQDMLISAICAQ